MRRVLLTAMLMAGLGGDALAQVELAVEDTRCWHGSQSYSIGSLVRVGGRFYTCGEGSRWAVAENGGANCIYEDRNYSSGALVEVRDRVIACAPSGAWEAVAAE